MGERIERTCSVEGCGKPHLARGWCSVHYHRWRRNGDTATRWDSSGDPNTRKSVVGYDGLHRRLKKVRGTATDQVCAGCGGQASEWAYDYTDAETLYSNDSDSHPYSLDLFRYQAMCIPCHRRFDQGR